MDRFKFLAMVEEFPFLSECGGERNYRNCNGIIIKRATRELMDYTPQYCGVTGSLVGIDDRSRIDFILSDGSVIIKAVEDSGHVTHNEAYWDNEQWDGETVLEAIDRRNIARKLTFIVLVEYGYNIRNHYSLPDYRLTIFKPGKDFGWADLINKARQKAKAEVLAEANF